MAVEGADFSGYATKAGLKCSDGRTILPNAFIEQDGQRVPLVWQHSHDDPDNVLGHAVLENRSDGVYAYCFLNETPKAQNTRLLIQHEDVNRMSIYANRLVEKSKQVMHGVIREVSLVLSGANPGALIDNIAVQHSDGDVEVFDDEAVIYTGLELQHADTSTATKSSDTKEGDDKADRKDEKTDTEEETPKEKSAQEIYDSMSEEQKNVVDLLVGAAATAASEAAKSEAAQHAEDEDDEDDEDEDVEDESAEHDDADDDSIDHMEGNEMTHNVFDKTDDKKPEAYHLTHSDIEGIFQKAQQLGTLKEAVDDFALQHGIEDIEVLFPDAQAISNTPEVLARRQEWVKVVLGETKHTPFSRIKSLVADLTYDEARAKGYIKGSLKKEEFFKVAKRVTTPQTIYKKQKLDRDDIIDIKDFDVVAWLRAEMRLMLDEEIARAILLGDGRSHGDDDKINEDNIRPIADEHELYASTVGVELDEDSNYDDLVDAIVLNRRFYHGSGNPTFFTTEDTLSKLLLVKDAQGRRIYPTEAELASACRVSRFVPVEPMEDYEDLLGIMVNLNDYTVGADKGGEVNLFDDFDIDYNQYKYLIESRCSGALTKLLSAIVFKNDGSIEPLVSPKAKLGPLKGGNGNGNGGNGEGTQGTQSLQGAGASVGNGGASKTTGTSGSGSTSNS